MSSSQQQPPSWLTMSPGQFTASGTQASLFATDSQGRPGGTLFDADTEV